MLGKLIKVRFSMTVGSIFAKKKGKSGVGVLVVLALIGAMFAFMSASMAYLLGGMLVPNGLDSIYFAIFNIASFSLVFIFSIFETKSELYECRDNELLLSMPVPSRYIVLSRILSVLALNLIESAIIMLPAIVVYLVLGGGPLYAVGAGVSMIFLTLLSTSLATGVGYAVALLTSYFKHNSFLSVVLYLLFFIAYFVGYGALMGVVENMELDPEGSVAGLEAAFGGMKFLGEISLPTSAVFWIFLGVCVLVSAVAYIAVSYSYVSVITRTGRGRVAKYRGARLGSGSAFSAMCKKELSRFFTCPTYILNGAMGSIMTVLLSVYTLIDSANIRSMIGQITLAMGLDPVFTPAVFCAGIIIILSATNMTSVSAMSLEGGSFWIIKTSPVYTVTVLHAKLVPHLTLALPSAVIASVCLGISLGLEAPAFVILLVIAVCINLLYAIVGLIINVLLPKFKFENVAQVVKSSGAAGISMLGCLILSLVLFGGSFGLCFAIGGLISSVILAALLVILTLCAYFVLTGPIRRRAERLEP